MTWAIVTYDKRRATQETTGSRPQRLADLWADAAQEDERVIYMLVDLGASVPAKRTPAKVASKGQRTEKGKPMVKVSDEATAPTSKVGPIEQGVMPKPGWLKEGESLSPRDERGYAPRPDVEKFARSLSQAQLFCREMGHQWRPWVARYDDQHNSYERALRCSRCRTERWETISMTGAKQGNNYRYPEGYVCELGRIVGEGRDAMRLESLTRMIQDPNIEHGEQRAAGAEKVAGNG